MAIPKDAIIEGRCYKTATNQVRRVLTIGKNGDVTYATHTRTESFGESTGRITEGLEHFAQQVTCEIPCESGNRGAGWT